MVVVIHTTATPCLGRFPGVTMSVQQLPVVSRLFPTLTFGNDVIDLDRVFFGERPSTGTTSALWLLQPPGYRRFHLWMASQSGTPIHPVAVIRTRWSLHFHVAPVWGVGMTEASCPTLGRLEGPALSISHAPVLACDPVFGGVRMSVDGPAPQPRLERVVQLLEASRAPYRGIVQAPAPDLRIERLHQAFLLRMFVARDGLPEGVNLPLDGGWAGGDGGADAMEPTATIPAGPGFSRRILLDVEAQEVKSWLL